MKNFKLASSLVAFFMIAGGVFTTIIPSKAYAADCNTTFFGMPAWYRGLTKSDCSIKNISNKDTGTDYVTLQSFIWTIVLNVADGLFRIAGIISTGFIVWAGFQYMISQGNSAKVAAAKNTLTNAIIGLIVILLAVGITNFVLGLITK